MTLLEKIFQRQQELIDKYQELEKIPDYPLPINDVESQKWFKDFMWRTTEELVEAQKEKKEAWSKSLMMVDVPAYFEELSDSLHFLVELFILVGITPQELEDAQGVLEKLVPSRGGEGLCIYYLGLAGNELKNRPWKKTKTDTNIEAFKDHLFDAWSQLLGCFTAYGYDGQDIADFYFNKSLINKKRQNSGY